MKVLYWVSTSLICAFLLLSSYTYFFSKNTIEGVRDLGFPDFFRKELAVLKVAAAIILLVPAVPLKFKEWAYAGVALFLLTAMIAHIAHKDKFVITIINAVLMILLFLSNYYLHKLIDE
jgi:hypothetical protein